MQLEILFGAQSRCLLWGWQHAWHILKDKGGKTMTHQKNNRQQELSPDHIIGRDVPAFIVYDDWPPEKDPKSYYFTGRTKCPKGFTGSDKDDSETMMCCILALCAVASLLLGSNVKVYSISRYNLVAFNCSRQLEMLSLWASLHRGHL